MSKRVKFVYSVSFEPVVDQKIKDYYQDPSQQVSTLRVRVAATHAGKITRNNGFYLPHKMRDGVASFTAQYPKPIQVHHESHQDPVGRVVAARYVDISQGLMDAWDGRKVCDDKRPIQDEALRNFCDGKMPMKEIIKLADEYFISDESIVDDPDYQGLGYIELTADITDPDAIRKVLDKRYLTGSIGASTDSAICSICKENWAGEDGPCEHRPGKVYDGKKCVLIAGTLEYEEWSFVNSPADTHSSVISIDSGGGVFDAVEVDDCKGKDDSVSFEILDSTQDQNIKGVSVKTGDYEGHKHIARVDEDGDGECDWVCVEEEREGGGEQLASGHSHPVTGWVVQTSEGHTHTLENPLKSPRNSKQEAQSKEETNMLDLKDKKQVEQPAPPADKEDNLQVEDATPPVEKVDASPAKPAEVKVEDDATTGKEETEEVKDTKNTEAKVTSETDDGDNGDEGSSGDVKDAADEGNVQDEVDLDDTEVDVVAQALDSLSEAGDEILLKLLEATKKLIKERELDCPCSEDEAQLKERVDAMKKEIKFLLEDADVLNSQLADLLEANRGLKVEKICDYSKLLDITVDGTEEVEKISEAPTETIDKILKDLTGQVDIGGIADKLNSGLSNDPQGTVESPVVTTDNQIEDKSKIKIDRAALETIRANYYSLCFTRGQVLADQYLADLQARGILPSEGFQIEDKS